MRRPEAGLAMGGKWICANFSPQLHQHLWAKLQHHTEIKWSHGILLLHRENHWLENLNVCFWEKWKCRRVPSARAFPLSTSRNDAVARGWGVGRKMKWQLFKALGLSELYCGKTEERFCVTRGTLFSRAFWEDSSHIPLMLGDQVWTFSKCDLCRGLRDVMCLLTEHTVLLQQRKPTRMSWMITRNEESIGEEGTRLEGGRCVS